MRGKNGVAAARRREQDAGQALKAEVDRNRQDRGVLIDEIRDLKTVVQQLQGRLRSEVHKEAAEYVQNARDQAAMEIAACDAGWRERIRTAFRNAEENGGFGVVMEYWPTFCDDLGVQFGELALGDRQSRRMTNSKMRKNMDEKRQDREGFGTQNQPNHAEEEPHLHTVHLESVD